MGAVRIRHSIREIATQPVIVWILLCGKPQWLPLNFGYPDVIRTAPVKKTSPNGCSFLSPGRKVCLLILKEKKIN